jgi:hypothetical protein
MKKAVAKKASPAPVRVATKPAAQLSGA